METGYKRFDQELYDKYDAEGKEAAKRWFAAHTDYEVRELEGEGHKFAQDFALFYNGEFHGYLEVEVKATWDTDRFPFSSVNVPYRKMKFILPGIRTLFFLVNRNFTRAAMIDSADVYHAQEQRIPNKFSERDEVFKQVDLRAVQFLKLDV